MLGGLFFVPMVSLLGILVAWYRRDPRRFLDGPVACSVPVLSCAAPASHFPA
jgi:hypothetical protein